MGLVFLVIYNKFLGHNVRKGNKFGIKPLKGIFDVPRTTKTQIISEMFDVVMCKETIIKGRLRITQPRLKLKLNLRTWKQRKKFKKISKIFNVYNS